MLSKPVKTDVHLKEKCSRLARHPIVACLATCKTKTYEKVQE